jgi:adenine deaminase
MKVMMRYGSSWHDVITQMKAVTEQGIDPRHFLLCTDDCHAATLLEEGHMDRVLRHAISAGLAPVLAIQMATINTADHFNVSRQMGQIAPGRWADILFVDDLNDFHAQTVIAKGMLIARDGKLLVSVPPYPYPAWAMNSVHLPRTIHTGDFNIQVQVNEAASPVSVHAIGVIENQAPTRHLIFKMQPENGQIRPDISRDIAKIALIERHRATGNIQVALVSGFGFSEKCAVATTVAHDCHHMIVVGTDEEAMAMAANRLAETGGGQVVFKDGAIIGEVQLPIAGLISNQPVAMVAGKAASVLAGFLTCGCKLNSPNMQLALLGLVVIPELRISDKGLVDVTKFECIPVIDY